MSGPISRPPLRGHRHGAGVDPAQLRMATLRRLQERLGAAQSLRTSDGAPRGMAAKRGSTPTWLTAGACGRLSCIGDSFFELATNLADQASIHTDKNCYEKLIRFYSADGAGGLATAKLCLFSSQTCPGRARLDFPTTLLGPAGGNWPAICHGYRTGRRSAAVTADTAIATRTKNTREDSKIVRICR